MINNKKAYFEYQILEEFVAGMQLTGSEVKSLREGTANITDSYVVIQDGEVYVRNMHISKYKESSWTNHEEIHDRKLLLTKKEIRDLQKKLKVNGITIVPLTCYTVHGRFKLKIALARGKKTYDKKKSIKERETFINSMRE